MLGRLYDEFDDRPKMSQEYLRIHINGLKSKKEVLTCCLKINSVGTPHTRKKLRRVFEMLRSTKDMEAARQWKAAERIRLHDDASGRNHLI